MAAATAMLQYDMPSVSAMMKAAAPITGGMSWPPIDARRLHAGGELGR